MARAKEFDREHVLEVAIGVFGQNGYSGTSTSMLTGAMKIGRQSLYDTFGDKWKLYCEALQRYADDELIAHLTALRRGDRAMDGIRALIERVVGEARKPCLGVSSICEFGESNSELNKMHQRNGRILHSQIESRISQARNENECLDEGEAALIASFILASIASIRVAARGGASDTELEALGRLTIRALI